MTDKPTGLGAALAAFQASLPIVKKTKTARVKTKSGEVYTYSYADLAEVSAVVLPLLGKHGLSFNSRPTLQDGRFVLAYSLLHESGESLAGEYPLPANGSAQEFGSAISYARRYALCSVVGVAAEDDDDGQAANHVRVDARRRRDYDPVDQQVLVDGWLSEIAKAPTAEALHEIGQALKAGRQLEPGEDGALSKNSYDHCVKAGAARKAELNGAPAT